MHSLILEVENMGLKRVENVLDYLMALDREKPLEQMSCAETRDLLQALGWKDHRDFEFARRKLLCLVRFITR
jgi:hypothetical protein